MWTKQTPTQPQSQPQPPAQQPTPSHSTPVFQRTPDTNAEPISSRPTMPTARSLACIGASVEIKGRISGEEDLQIDGKVEGPIAIRGHRLTVGRSGQVNSEVSARELVVYGKVTGNVNAADRVEIKKDGAVIGDIITARISIEDGAVFKGRIEIDRPSSKPAPAPAPAKAEEPTGVLVGAH
jgi:cytoskeletal protein CcmA (bactofilin family)